jgi:hypothetical protein
MARYVSDRADELREKSRQRVLRSSERWSPLSEVYGRAVGGDPAALLAIHNLPDITKGGKKRKRQKKALKSAVSQGGTVWNPNIVKSVAAATRPGKYDKADYRADLERQGVRL